MSASESDAKKPAAAEPDEPAPFVESAADAHETRLEYDHSSRVPKIVMAVWATLLVSYVIYMVKYFLPDLMKWGRP